MNNAKKLLFYGFVVLGLWFMTGLGNAAGVMNGLHAEAPKTSSADTTRVYLIEILEEIAQELGEPFRTA